MKRRHFLATAAVAAGLALGQPALAQTDDIRVGYIADFWGASATAIATKMGLWEKHGLRADTKVFTNGPLQIQALGADSLDFGYIGPGALWLPASGKARIVAINTVGNSDRVLGQAGVTSIADLKGRKVAVPEGTSGDMLLGLLLEREGMTRDDLEIVTADPATVVSAFASKQVDGAAIWYPFVDVIRKANPDVVELAKNADFPQNQFPSSFVARNEMVADRPEVVGKFIAVMKEAGDWRHANLDEAVTVTAEFLSVDPALLAPEAKMGTTFTAADLAAKSQDGTVAGWLDGMAAIYVAQGKLENPLPATDFYAADLYTK
ncbi:aliphatic sulfonate ABC transporter substrate-binding protein [Paracoccus shandongensis]|uniref:aliphatic sulfonate ABC transporter substrate-binding protein n=1 Tax=Paracoccus shandongensis TaxID=2816048 RepID=UPI001A8CC7A5|nr:aliphatic sulfonate ABC transporter substrate-binding protein [Paracoccus shandongensis]